VSGHILFALLANKLQPALFPLDSSTHTHTHGFAIFVGTLHRHNGFYTVQSTNCIIYPLTP